jgi:hypothetical protein
MYISQNWRKLGVIETWETPGIATKIFLKNHSRKIKLCKNSEVLLMDHWLAILAMRSNYWSYQAI